PPTASPRSRRRRPSRTRAGSAPPTGRPATWSTGEEDAKSRAVRWAAPGGPRRRARSTSPNETSTRSPGPMLDESPALGPPREPARLDAPPEAPEGPGGRAAAMALALRKAIDDRSARVGVIGLGHVGLPLIGIFAAGGFPVLGLDMDGKTVRSLRSGRSYIGHIPSERVAALNESGRFEASDDFARLASCDAVLICV